jgi:NAD(P)H dehydrogenase (quinone)
MCAATHLAPVLEHGAVFGATKNMPFGVASRADYAAATVAVLTSTGRENKAYELANDANITLRITLRKSPANPAKRLYIRICPPKPTSRRCSAQACHRPSQACSSIATSA